MRRTAAVNSPELFARITPWLAASDNGFDDTGKFHARQDSGQVLYQAKREKCRDRDARGTQDFTLPNLIAARFHRFRRMPAMPRACAANAAVEVGRSPSARMAFTGLSRNSRAISCADSLGFWKCSGSAPSDHGSLSLWHRSVPNTTSTPSFLPLRRSYASDIPACSPGSEAASIFHSQTFRIRTACPDNVLNLAGSYRDPITRSKNISGGMLRPA